MRRRYATLSCQADGQPTIDPTNAATKRTGFLELRCPLYPQKKRTLADGNRMAALCHKRPLHGLRRNLPQRTQSLNP
jgi:hypothetical protein